MNVQPTILGNVKYRALRRRLGAVAMEVLVRLWGYCQTGQRGEVLGRMKPEYLEQVLEWEGAPGVLYAALTERLDEDHAGFVEVTEGGVLVAHSWDEENSRLVCNWKQGRTTRDKWKESDDRQPRPTPKSEPSQGQSVNVKMPIHGETGLRPMPESGPEPRPLDWIGLDWIGLDRIGVEGSGDSPTPQPVGEAGSGKSDGAEATSEAAIETSEGITRPGLAPTFEKALAFVRKMGMCPPGSEEQYGEAEVRQAWLGLEAGKTALGQWTWGRNLVTDWRAPLESRLHSEWERKMQKRGGAGQGAESPVARRIGLEKAYEAAKGQLAEMSGRASELDGTGRIALRRLEEKVGKMRAELGESFK